MRCAWPWILALCVACSGGDEPVDDGGGDPQGGGAGIDGPGIEPPPDEPESMFPSGEADRLPGALRIEVAGEAAAPGLVEELLASAWSNAMLSEPERAGAELLAEFFAEPRDRCAAVVRETLLDRLAVERYPELDAEQLDALAVRLGASSGGRYRWVLEVDGEDAARRYLVRFHRRELLEGFFADASEEVTEDEVYQVYEREVLANLPPPEQRQGMDVSLATRGPEIRERLQRARGLDDMQAWSEERAATASVVVVLPDGTRVSEG